MIDINKKLQQFLSTNNEKFEKNLATYKALNKGLMNDLLRNKAREQHESFY
jgi:hypothetical protein